MAKIKEKATKVAPKWEIKDKIYELCINETPIVYMVKSRGILWFDEEKGYEREIKYCENQKTVFVDEMKGPDYHILFLEMVIYTFQKKNKLYKSFYLCILI